jgi:hypothetical protein
VCTHPLGYAIEITANTPIYQKRSGTHHQHHKAHRQTEALAASNRSRNRSSSQQPLTTFSSSGVIKLRV